MSFLLPEHSVFLPQSLALNLSRHPLYSLLGSPTGPRTPSLFKELRLGSRLCPYLFSGSLTSQEVAVTPELPSHYLLIPVPSPPCPQPLPVTLSPSVPLGTPSTLSLDTAGGGEWGRPLLIRTSLCSQLPKPTPNLCVVTLPPMMPCCGGSPSAPICLNTLHF